ncbi:hypothetical protein AYI68_g709 [Smittium mucronatum]|uniref:DUF202 domain-containing protein n=1 Tax=Smittium mucronatum TaxID=133383 RepID=A0A1R0H7I6_9FUNG|nr:hypothetical protein AYI68_g709 [Smittium mucronatum]
MDSLQTEVDSFSTSRIKSFLANERTLIKWLQLSVTISGLGLTILNFGPQIRSMFIVSALVEIGAFVIILSSYISFIDKARRISRDERGSFYIQVLPICVIVFFVLTAMVIAGLAAS